MTAILVAPERGRRAYRMRCAFTVPSGTTGRTLELATLEAGKRFIRDMGMRGYEWKSKYGYKLEGPFNHIETLDLPGKAIQRKNVRDTSLVRDMNAPTGDEDWRLTMTFVMPERYIQTREEACR